MIKQKVCLEVIVNERCYSLDCLSDSPLGEIHDALCQMKQFVIQKMLDAEKVKEPESKEE